MKRLLSLFPLLKTVRFYAVSALFLGVVALTGLLYLPEEESRTFTFEDEKAAIEEALAQAERLRAEDPQAATAEEICFYQGALKFRLSPWSSYFASEALSLYARLMAEDPSSETLEKLENILARRDKNALYELCRQDPKLPDPDPRLLSAKDTPATPGQSAALYDLDLLEQSLAKNRDLYFATERPLSKADQALFRSLLEQKEKQLEHGTYNPVPANRETLASIERFAGCLMILILLWAAGSKKGRGTHKRSPWALLLPAAWNAILCALVLWAVTLWRAPGTVEPSPLQWGGSLPFFPALFLRLFCIALGSLPLVILCEVLSEQKKNGTLWKLFALSPLLRFLLQSTELLLPRQIAAALSAGNLAECLFPPVAVYSLRPAAPWAGVLLWTFSLAAVLIWTGRKEQKITPEKQELSLEKPREL